MEEATDMVMSPLPAAESQSLPSVVYHVRLRFGRIAQPIEAEAFRKGLINVSIDELYARLRQLCGELYIKLVRQVGDVVLGETVGGLIYESISEEYGPDSARELSALLLPCLNHQAQLYATFDNSFLFSQLRQVQRAHGHRSDTRAHNAYGNRQPHQHQNGERTYHAAHACVDHMHGRCSRGDSCRFNHNVPADVRVSRVHYQGPTGVSAAWHQEDRGHHSRRDSVPVAGTVFEVSLERDASLINIQQRDFSTQNVPPRNDLETNNSSSNCLNSFEPTSAPLANSISSRGPSPNERVSEAQHNPYSWRPEIPPPPLQALQHAARINATQPPLPPQPPLPLKGDGHEMIGNGQLTDAPGTVQGETSEESLSVFLKENNLINLHDALFSAGVTIACLRGWSRADFENSLRSRICSRSLRISLWESLHPEDAQQPNPVATPYAPLCRDPRKVVTQSQLQAFLTSNAINAPTTEQTILSTEGVLGEASEQIVKSSTRVDTKGDLKTLGQELRAVVWLSGVSRIPLETLEAMVNGVGNHFESGFRGEGPEDRDWAYFKLSSYEKELQAARFLLTSDGHRVTIADKTLFGPGHRDDGCIPQAPQPVHIRQPAAGTFHSTRVAPRRDVPRGPRDAPPCKFFLSNSCSRGDACTYRHTARDVAHEM